MANDTTRYETGPEDKKMSIAGKYPRLRPEQIQAVHDRKENPVSNRYIAADLTEETILKFYAQLRTMQPDHPSDNASSVARQVFASHPKSAQAEPTSIPTAEWQTSQKPLTEVQPLPAETGSRPVEHTSTDTAAPAQAPTGLDMSDIRARIDSIHGGAKKGQIINDSMPEVLQQFTELGSEEPEELSRAA